jgi:hypothetical protein
MDSICVAMWVRSSPYRIANAEFIGVSENHVAQCEADPIVFHKSVTAFQICLVRHQIS